MRFLLRLASVLMLLAGVLLASVDAIQSVSASSMVLTPLGAAMASLGQGALEFVQSLERPAAVPAVWDPLLRWLLLQPAFAVLMAVALLFWMLAYRRPAAAGRFAA